MRYDFEITVVKHLIYLCMNCIAKMKHKITHFVPVNVNEKHQRNVFEKASSVMLFTFILFVIGLFKGSFRQTKQNNPSNKCIVFVFLHVNASYAGNNTKK